MDENIHDKVIVTTRRKLQLVQKLGEYWSMKGALMYSRKDPQLLQTVEHQEKTVEYLNTNSDMRKHKFWSTLSAAKQLASTKVMTFQEVSDDSKKIRMVTNRKEAEVYIVLSGSATVQGQPGGDQTYGPGQCFGGLDFFENAQNFNGDFDRDDDNDKPQQQENQGGGTTTTDGGDVYIGEDGAPKLQRRKSAWNIVTAKFSKGAFMRLSLHDFYKYVLKPEIFTQNLEEMKNDANISGLNYDDLTKEDHHYIRVFKKARANLNSDLFNFMNSYQMIPRNARMHAHKYHNEGNVGRESYMLSTDPIYVFVVINGSMRVEITTVSNASQHTVNFKKKGARPMVVQTKSMPLLSLQSGSMLCLHKECYTVGQKELAERILREKLRITGEYYDPSVDTVDANGHVSHAPVGSGTTNKNTLNGTIKTGSASGTRKLNSGGRDRKPSEISIASNQSDSQNRDKKGRLKPYVPRARLHKIATPVNPKARASSAPTNDSENHSTDEPLYHIKMVFEQPTSYLAVPLEVFENTLADDRLILPRISAEIKGQLHFANSNIYQRISNVMPWILGHQDFVSKPDSHRKQPLPVVDEVATEPMFDIYDTAEQCNEISTAPQGSFLRHTNIHPLPSARSSDHSVNSHHSHNSHLSRVGQQALHGTRISQRELRDQERLLLSKSLTSLPQLIGSSRPLGSNKNSSNNSVASVQSHRSQLHVEIPSDIQIPDMIQIPISVSVRNNLSGRVSPLESSPMVTMKEHYSPQSVTPFSKAKLQIDTTGDNLSMQSKVFFTDSIDALPPSPTSAAALQRGNSYTNQPYNAMSTVGNLSRAGSVNGSINTANSPGSMLTIGGVETPKNSKRVSPFEATFERTYPVHRAVSFDSSIEDRLREKVDNIYADAKLINRHGSISMARKVPLIRADTISPIMTGTSSPVGRGTARNSPRRSSIGRATIIYGGGVHTNGSITTDNNSGSDND